jgi:hypothetical protein
MAQYYNPGEIVFCWLTRAWHRVIGVESAVLNEILNLDGFGKVAASQCSRDPFAEIPPKPRITVTKEVEMILPLMGASYAGINYIYVKQPGLTIPAQAKNIRCLYDIEEDQ